MPQNVHQFFNKSPNRLLVDLGVYKTDYNLYESYQALCEIFEKRIQVLKSNMFKIQKTKFNSLSDGNRQDRHSALMPRILTDEERARLEEQDTLR